MSEPITEDEFREFEAVRQSGRFNMIMEQNRAALAAGLSLQTYQAILSQYEELDDKWPHVRAEER